MGRAASESSGPSCAGEPLKRNLKHAEARSFVRAPAVRRSSYPDHFGRGRCSLRLDGGLETSIESNEELSRHHPLDALAQTTVVTELVALIATEYDVGLEQASIDVDAFLADLAQLGLVRTFDQGAPVPAGESSHAGSSVRARR